MAVKLLYIYCDGLNIYIYIYICVDPSISIFICVCLPGGGAADDYSV